MKALLSKDCQTASLSMAFPFFSSFKSWTRFFWTLERKAAQVHVYNVKISPPPNDILAGRWLLFGACFLAWGLSRRLGSCLRFYDLPIWVAPVQSDTQLHRHGTLSISIPGEHKGKMGISENDVAASITSPAIYIM